MSTTIPAQQSVYRIKPHLYIHVLDNNTNVTRLVVGPKTFTRQNHETVLTNQLPMITIPPRHYVTIGNPIVKDINGDPVFDASGQVKLRYSDEEIRFEQDLFPLYPGEKLIGGIIPLQVVQPNFGLHLKALRDVAIDSVLRVAGDEWLFKGPGTYIPRVEVQVVATVQPVIIKPNEAIRLQALRDFADRDSVPRKAGEYWLIRQPGSYLLDVNEIHIDTIKAIVLTEKKAVHLKSIVNHTDVFGKRRKAGEEWLVTFGESAVYIPDPSRENVLGEVYLTTLNSRQYCVVLDPFIDGSQRMGQRRLVAPRGEDSYSFFLHPGERLENGIQNIYVLDSEESLLLMAVQKFKYEGKELQPGERWMVYGPNEFIPPVEVKVIERRRNLTLDKNEGVYVRDINTGVVRSVSGCVFSTSPNEELWKKELPETVEQLLSRDLTRDPTEANRQVSVSRDKTRIVTYRIPRNAAVQLYDSKTKKARVVFGPDLVMLGPDEDFKILNLSTGVPKKSEGVKALALFLGPDFMKDEIIVETSDHARLKLLVSYNWHFEIKDRNNQEEASKLFKVQDFVGDSCKTLASKIRGEVSSRTFDSFHRNSSKLVEIAIFGVDEKGSPLNNFKFVGNNLVISNVDVQTVEPVDQRTRDALQKSVQMAIEITTKSQEAEARQEAERREQEAKGKLECKSYQDQIESEKKKKELVTLQAKSAQVEIVGAISSEARAKAEASLIESRAAVQKAKLQAEAFKIKSEVEFNQKKQQQEIDIKNRKELIELEISKAKEIAEVEEEKFAQIISTIGPTTIKEIAQAGPEMQSKILKGLGLKGFLITDGNSPINLFNTAQGLVSAPGEQKLNKA